MKNRFYAYIFSLISGLSFAGSDAYLGSAIALETDELDYEMIHQGSDGEMVFSIANMGMTPLRMLASMPPGVDSIEFSNMPIPPKERVQVKIKINTNHITNLRRNIFFFTSDFGVPVFSIPVNADIVPVTVHIPSGPPTLNLSKIEPVQAGIPQAIPQRLSNEVSKGINPSSTSGSTSVEQKTPLSKYSKVRERTLNSGLLRRMLY